MNYHIVRIRGRSATSRERHLAAVQAWMAARGWTLEGYGEDSHQALFEPSPDWPGGAVRRPRPWQQAPGGWGALREEWLTPRNIVLGGVAVAALAALFAMNAQRTRFDPEAAAQQAGERWWTVTGDNINVREGPSAEAAVVARLHNGQRVLVGSRGDGWIEVVQPERGWVAEKLLAPPEDSR